MDAGAGATSQLLSLLGINQFTPGTPGGGGGSFGGGGGSIGGTTLAGLARSGVGGTSGTGGTSGGGTGAGTGTGTGDTETVPYGGDPYNPAFRRPSNPNDKGYERPFPYTSPPGQYIGGDPNPNYDPTQTEGLPSLYPGSKGLLNVSSGGKGGV